MKLDFIKSNNGNLPFTKANYIIMILGIIIIGKGYLIMALDPEEYGFGVLGITVGPIIVLLGFTVLLYSIFKTSKGANKKELSNDSEGLIDRKYARIKNITGWLIFATALTVYTITVEPTVSLWDCGEFIAASYKLEIPHPPGTPLFLIFGRIFSLFAPNKETIALCVNMISVVSSSFTIYILYHSIHILGKRILNSQSKDQYKNILLTLAATCGSLCFAFSDSFWFNATEAEVYALSCLFTALVFWAMLKWQEAKQPQKESKWLLFLSCLIGLSMGVHLLNLVAIPALALIYYYKKYSFTWKGLLFTMVISVVLIVLLMEGVIIGIPSLAAYVDRIFVNTFHFPFGSGVILFFILLIALLCYGIYYSIIKEKKWLNIIILATIFILLGSSSNIIIPIRSAYNPPMDENDPEDITSLVLYLKRDQYGSRPLLKGPYFTAGHPEEIIKKSPRYRKDADSGRYVISDYDYEYVYNKKHTTLFPRLHYTDERNKEAYREWLHLKEGKKPTMSDNMKFMWDYQLGHMFWRYFMWNFAGRESDIQNAGWLKPTQWFNLNIPDTIKNNKAKNNYFMLPLLLGIAGAIYHFRRQSKDVWCVTLLFLFCGLVINIYLNQPPVEPRERDYTYVGAFYAFSIWIGLGVLFIADLMSRIFKSRILLLLLTLILSHIAPAIMAIENWNDHDRSGRYFAKDISFNTLQSCESNAILFTAADNDTFPLWYAQEVEDFRTDVRICNLSLLNMDWYISSMKRKSNASEALPISLQENNYIRGKNDQVFLVNDPASQNEINFNEYLKLIKSDDRSIKYPAGNGEEVTIIPGNNLFLKTNKTYMKNDIIDLMDQMQFNINGNLSKSELIVLDIIATNNWKRPIYFNHTSISDFPYLKKYTIKEGMLYRLLPIRPDLTGLGNCDTEKMYRNLIKQAHWRGLNNLNVYTDPASAPFIAATRMDFFNLALRLYYEQKKEKAKEVLIYSLKTIPDECFKYDYTLLSYPELLFALKEDELAIGLCKKLGERSLEELKYYYLYPNHHKDEIQYSQQVLNEIISILENNGRKELSIKYKERLERFKI